MNNKKTTETKLKYPVNQDYFDKINYKNAWILGFLTADGYLIHDKRCNDQFGYSLRVKLQI